MSGWQRGPRKSGSLASVPTSHPAEATGLALASGVPWSAGQDRGNLGKGHLASVLARDTWALHAQRPAESRGPLGDNDPLCAGRWAAWGKASGVLASGWERGLGVRRPRAGPGRWRGLLASGGAPEGLLEAPGGWGRG